MYLGGILTLRLSDGSVVQSGDIGTIDNYFNTRGAVALKPDGSPYVRRMLFGGTLLDGCPLNVILGQGWITNPDQQAALRQAGIFECLPGGNLVAPPAATPPPPNAAFVAAPGWTPSPAANLGPTGIATPSAPPIVYAPSGPVYTAPEPTGTDAELMHASLFDFDSNTLLLAGGAVALAFLFSRRRGK